MNVWISQIKIFMNFSIFKSSWISQFKIFVNFSIENLHEFLNLKSSWLSQLKIFIKFSIENLHRVDLTCSTIFKFIQSTKTKIIQWFYKINSTKNFHTLSMIAWKSRQMLHLLFCRFVCNLWTTWRIYV